MWSTWKESLSETRDTNQKLLNNGLYCHMYVVYFIKMNNNTGRATSTAAIVLLIPPPDLVKFSCCFIFSLDFMDSFVAHSSSFFLSLYCLISFDLWLLIPLSSSDIPHNSWLCPQDVRPLCSIYHMKRVFFVIIWIMRNVCKTVY